MVDENLHDKIEQYLLGQLSSEATARLEAEMAADPALADQVALQRLALMGIQRLAARDMRVRFDQWDAEIDDPPSTPTPPEAPITAGNPWIWTTIATLLLLIAGAFWHFDQIGQERTAQERERRELALRDSLIAVLQQDYQQKTDELKALLETPGSRKDSLALLEIKRLREELNRKDQSLRELENRRPAGKPQIALRLAPPAGMLTRGAGDEADKTLAAAKKAFGKPDFKEAVRLLKSIPANDPRQAQVVQLLPYALFYAGQYQEAIPAFLQLWELDEDNEYMYAQGYLLLCYIAEGKMLEARQIRLVIMNNPGHKFYDMANEAGKEIR
jgi:tetratricopeptide (TPR) repeat protein